MAFVSRLWRRGPVCGKRERRGEWRERPAEEGGSGSLARGAPPAGHVWAPLAGPCAAVHALRPLGCRPAPRRAGSRRQRPRLCHRVRRGRAGRPGAAPSAGGRSRARGRSGLPSRDLGLCSPVRSGGKKIIRRRRSEFPGCSHSETQAGKLADAWPAPR